ncbi:class I SAM-dependent methyltransferase [Nocardia fusca]|uniref:class I SAM-dependent methyltransferase n=1 Tax=Nocardia fusca TaxID=941183 RepID=UPI0007A76675|nr:class I SAM-dependent methyltransferase [Nocardia fusca]
MRRSGFRLIGSGDDRPFQAGGQRIVQVGDFQPPQVDGVMSFQHLGEGCAERAATAGTRSDGRVYRDYGFDVTLGDASARSVEKLRESGFDARKINMITDDFGGPWDGISINGGVPHLSDDELDKVVEKAAASLSDGGILAYNFELADAAELIGHQRILNKGAERTTT